MSHDNSIKSTDVRTCKEQLRKLYGLEPHNRGFNPCYQDSWFSMSIKNEFDPETIKQAKSELRIV